MSRPFFRTLVKIPGFLLLFVISSAVKAEDASWMDGLNINGFYTVDLSYSDSNVPVLSNGLILRPLEADEFTLKNSIFGLQVSYDFTGDLSVFMQGVALYDERGDLDADLDWAYLSYDLGRDYTFRAGKFQIPILQGTELKSVGYSRLWVRPVVPGSGAAGFSDFSGAELLKNIALENSNIDIQLSLGQASHDLEPINGKALGLISVAYEKNSFWIRGALAQIDYDISTPRGQLIDDNAKVVMASLEAETEINNFILNGGLSATDADVTPNDSLAYLSVGYRIGDFTPYILGKKLKQKFSRFNTATPTGPSPPTIGAAPPGLPSQQPPAPPDGTNNYSSLALGFRFDFTGNYALKGQWEFIDIDNGTRDPRGSMSGDGHVLSILFEGVF